MMTKPLTAFVGVVSIAANGQQKPAPSTTSQLAWVSPEGREMGHLAEEELMGSWETAEKFDPDALLKTGASASGVFTIPKGPGGNSPILNYQSQSSTGSYTSTRINY
jgi:hypothetical protein